MSPDARPGGPASPAAPGADAPGTGSPTTGPMAGVPDAPREAVAELDLLAPVLPDAPEAWLAGPIPGVPGLLQPVAHALVQARRELRVGLADFPDARLWERPAGVASVGFHLQHLSGVLDRLTTYARGDALDAEQLAALAAEGRPDGAASAAGAPTVAALLDAFDRRVAAALAQLRATEPATLLEPRHVGRRRLPSTVLGLLGHAAEHTMRHLGQLLVTARIARAAAGERGEAPPPAH